MLRPSLGQGHYRHKRSNVANTHVCTDAIVAPSAFEATFVGLQQSKLAGHPPGTHLAKGKPAPRPQLHRPTQNKRRPAKHPPTVCQKFGGWEG